MTRWREISTEEPDYRPVGEYRDRVVIPPCWFHDIISTEMLTWTEQYNRFTPSSRPASAHMRTLFTHWSMVQTHRNPNILLCSSKLCPIGIESVDCPTLTQSCKVLGWGSIRIRKMKLTTKPTNLAYQVKQGTIATNHAVSRVPRNNGLSWWLSMTSHPRTIV